jgi:thiol-disulfide isomerase/thioredoxin
VLRAYRLFLAILIGVAAAGPVSGADVEIISHGREVVLEDHLVPGKYVLFDFYADWCGPCRALEPHLAGLAERHTDQLVVRKIDIINWDSPVARQHRLSSIPHLVLYGPDGRRIASGDAGSVLHRLEAALGDGRTVPPAGGDRSSPLVAVLAVAAIFAVAAALVLRRRTTAAPSSRASSPVRSPPPVDTAARPDDPAIWFTLVQGSLEGPLTRSQLGELVDRRVLDRSAAIRRKGDADWSTLSDVLD